MAVINSIADAAIEKLKCKDLETGFQYFLENYAMLPESGTGNLIHFKPWPIQEETYIKTWVDIWRKEREACDKGTKPEKTGIIFMASRQCGKTQLTEALCVWLLICFNNYEILHFNRNVDFAKNIISEVHAMLDRLPNFLKPNYVTDTKDHGFTLDNGSSFRVESANSSNKKGGSSKGRGYRPMLVWIDEAAFVDLKEHLSAILPATSMSFTVALKNKIPYGVIYTSTPNGRSGTGEGFYKEWMACEQGDPTNLIAVKYLWNQTGVYDDKWFERVCATEHCTPDHINAKVDQEYNLKFIANDQSLFPNEIMGSLQDETKATKPVSEEKFKDGYIQWFELPDHRKSYIVGIDTATMDGTDSSTIQVIDYTTENQVCEAKFKCSVTDFCNVYIPKVIDYLPFKIIAIEKNGVGNQTLEMLSSKYKYDIFGDYTDIYNPKLGIHSTANSRRLCVEQIYNLFMYDLDKVKSYQLRLEATTLERRRNGRIEGVPHDDLCFAIGWCRYLLVHEPQFCMKHLSTARNTQSDSELFNMIPDINDDINDGYNPNVSDRNQNANVMTGGSKVVQRLLDQHTRNFSGTTAEEVMEMFQTYGVRSKYHDPDDVWDLI